MKEQASGGETRRVRRSREASESDLLEAALHLLRRDGVLAGINLREVAKQARVNHGQIYQYFGSRRTLLRAAITRLLEDALPDVETHWNLAFIERRRQMWKWMLAHAEAIHLQALMALDGGDVRLFPELKRTREALERDVAEGNLPPDADTDMAHAMSAVTYLGYSVFRETLATELDTSLADLDSRAAAAFDRMLVGLASPPDQHPRE